MPYRSGLIQTAIGALFAATFIISNSFSSSEGKQKRLVGAVTKAEPGRLHLKDSNGREHQFEVSRTSTTVYLNERVVQLTESEKGRNASIIYEKKGRTLQAKIVNLFPTHHDFKEETSPSSSA
jgi:hypothetical protein